MLGHESYAPETDPGSRWQISQDRGRISVYAQGKDYHDVVKKMLKALARWIVETTGCELKVFVDTAPVMEKPLGQQAGIGWQGKHSNLVSRDHGSWLFLARSTRRWNWTQTPPKLTIAAVAPPARALARRTPSWGHTASMPGVACLT